MLKKLVVLLLTLSVFLAFGATVYAAPEDKDASGSGASSGSPAAAAEPTAFEKMLAEIIKDTEAINTEQLLATITKPDKEKEASYEKSYIVTGTALKSDIRVCIAKYNEETKQYELFSNTDGKSSWDVAKGNVFSKEILLAKGANKVKIIVYSTADTDSLKKEDIQVNSFTISLLDKNSSNVKDVIKNTINNITDDIKNLFDKK